MGVCLFAPAPASAAIWQSPDWALSSDVNGSITYDNNITGIRGGAGDTIFDLTPSLLLARRGSLTDLQITADLAIRSFADHSTENSVDPSLRAKLNYPSGEESLHSQSAQIRLERHNVADFDLGRRIRRTDLAGSWDGQIYDTGKTSVSGRLDAGYSDNDLNSATDQNGAVGFSVEYAPRELLQVGVAYEFSVDQYRPGIPGVPNPEVRTHHFYLQARGELSPKVTGSVHAGVGNSSYRGGVDGPSWDWLAGANLQWQVTERRKVQLDLERGTYFSVTGDLGMRSRLDVAFMQDIAGGYHASLRTGLASIQRRSGTEPDYDYYHIGGSVGYDLTGRFTAEVGADWEPHSSNVAAYDYNRSLFFGRCSYHF